MSDTVSETALINVNIFNLSLFCFQLREIVTQISMGKVTVIGENQVESLLCKNSQALMGFYILSYFTMLL